MNNTLKSNTIGLTAQMIWAALRQIGSLMTENHESREQKNRQAYLEKSLDHYDLEYRMRQLDKHVTARRY